MGPRAMIRALHTPRDGWSVADCLELHADGRASVGDWKDLEWLFVMPSGAGPPVHAPRPGSLPWELRIETGNVKLPSQRRESGVAGARIGWCVLARSWR